MRGDSSAPADDWGVVDKTFAYVVNPDYDGTNLRALLVAHHSSEEVGETSIKEGPVADKTTEELEELISSEGDDGN